MISFSLCFVVLLLWHLLWDLLGNLPRIVAHCHKIATKYRGPEAARQYSSVFSYLSHKPKRLPIRILVALYLSTAFTLFLYVVSLIPAYGELISLGLIVWSLVQWLYVNIGYSGPPAFPLARTSIGVFENIIRLILLRPHLYLQLTRICLFMGPVYELALPVYPYLYFVTDPDDVAHALQTEFHSFEKGEIINMALSDFLGKGIFATDGQLAKTSRKVSSHLFKRRLMVHSLEIFRERCGAVLKVFDKSQRVDVQDVFSKFTLDAFVEIAFGRRLNTIEEQKPFGKAFDMAADRTMDRLFNPFFQYLPINAKLKESVELIDNLANSVIRQHKTEGVGGEDILSRFLADDDDTSDVHLRDACVNFLLAARDTTSQLLTWTLYELSRNPEVEARVVEEIESLWPNQAPPQLDELKKAKYIKAVLDETLRLWPPVPLNFKECVKETKMPSGYTFPKGHMMCWSSFVLGRSPLIWDKPREFRPTRWLGDDGYKPSSGGHLPFNYGPRLCLGMNFAYTQATFVVAMIYQRFTMRHSPGHVAEAKTGVTMRAKYGMLMDPVQRK